MVLGRVGARVARVEPRKRLRQFVIGMMAGLPRVNCWTLAEHAGESCPRGMQRFLSEAVSDEDGLLEDARDLTISTLGERDAVLVIDETGDVKKDPSRSERNGSTPVPPGGSRTPRSRST